MSLPKLFIGSSREGSAVAYNLQSVLQERRVCETTVWDQGVFAPGGYAIDALIDVARGHDFAILVASPDDTTTSRGSMSPAVRDNVILELGLFIGVLGRERAYLLLTGDARLPSDVFGLTTLKYPEREDGNVEAAVGPAVLQVQKQVDKLGPRLTAPAVVASEVGRSLEAELELLCANAEAQGWTVKKNSKTTLRLLSPNGSRVHSLTKGNAQLTRDELRTFAAELRADGLRVNQAVLRPAAQSPL
ncbi:nucleotide-binding protein [Rhodococcus sp. NBC_00297]|uniref:nucleotide-binding protein n=1 Tax=Rhodococcus sp. NBC_00297 TaxID=2976005 RepID=UPI002E2BDFDE|nr:nucleotide-binding protein [Rhodococcus sp. NBC_00297]